MNKFNSIQDFEDYALKALSPNIRDYYMHGANSKTGIYRNIQAFKSIRIRPRLLKDVSKIDISTTILGQKISMPLGISPTAHQKFAHPEGECASVKAAEAVNVIFILSAFSSSSIQEVANSAPKALKWLQLSIYKDRECVLHIIRKAEEAGFRALVLTIDSPILPKSKDYKLSHMPESSNRAIFEDYFTTKYPNQTLGDIRQRILKLFDNTLTWECLTWLKSITKLPIILKGILTPEDALLGVKYGASAILVSNHGGRLIDDLPATIEVLPDIVKAVGDKVEVYLDGGVRQGADVFKALALGAKMVFIGRPMLWGLVCGGEEGARAILETMRQEIYELFSLTGCTSVKEVTKDKVIRESYYSHL